MLPEPPLPVLDLSSNGFVACLGAAARKHVAGDAASQRPRGHYGSEHREWAARPQPTCLYCRTADPDGGEEHVLSVALGNWFWVLPPGVVCRRCNNGILSTLDTALLRHPFIAMQRALVNVAGRSGQLPAMRASNMRLERRDDGTLAAVTNHRRHVAETDEGVEMRPKWVNHGVRQRRDTARALLKLALGVIWLAKGPAQTDLSKYDHVRDAIRGDKAIPLRDGFGNSALPNHALQVLVMSHEDLQAVRVSLDYFGIQLWAETEGARHEASTEFLATAI